MPNEPQRTSDNEDTGRFAIDTNERGTMLPPAEDGAKDVLSLEELGGSLIETRPRTAPPPPPARAVATVSGVVPTAGKADPDAAFAERIISLSPIYTPAETAQTERAVLDIEDLSLRPDNPYLASSLVPPRQPTGRRATLIAVAASVLLAGAGAGWYLVRSPQPAPRAQARHATRPATSSETAPMASAVAAPATTTVAVPVAVEAAKPAPVAPVAHRPAASDERRISAKAGAVALEAAVAQKLAPAPIAETVGPTPVETAAPVSAPTAETASVVDETLPAQPTREQVAAGFDAVRAELEQCASGQRGVATVSATIAGSGRVTYSVVQGKFAGTPEGSCMALAVRKAQFPRFSQPSLKVVYPFSL
jgi:hypothetical protein